ncbi:hypothetical protein BC834DRAFT_900452, partial [Gloeopeniophorella convolvens]
MLPQTHSLNPQMAATRTEIFQAALSMSMLMQAEILVDQNKEIMNDIKAIKRNTEMAWSLNTLQEDALRRIMLHWLIQPVNSYNKTMIPRIEEWMDMYAERKLQIYDYNESIFKQQAVRAFINNHQYADRSNLRAKIFASVDANESSSHFSDKMIKLYFQGVIDRSTRKMIHAQMALARRVARSILTQGLAKGKETHFWDHMESELQKLVKLHGHDRTKEGWVMWYDTIIALETAACETAVIGSAANSRSKRQSKRKRLANALDLGNVNSTPHVEEMDSALDEFNPTRADGHDTMGDMHDTQSPDQYASDD